MLRILLTGACGRMGRQVAAAAEETGAVIVAGVDVNPKDAPFPVYPSLSMVKEEADVIIDFSRPEGLSALLSYAREKQLPLVLAATGYNDADLAAIEQASAALPIFRSANMSLGVCVLRHLARQAAAMLEGYDIEIVEKHHNQKADAPSGTALMLYEAVKSPDSLPVCGRHTRTEKREAREIGLHAVRGGTVTGEHEVGFYGKGESILLTHAAQDRSLFAYGALRAARFIVRMAPGQYDMDLLAREITGN